eukprot:11736504-Alexandrium_andersonii.AAC.1
MRSFGYGVSTCSLTAHFLRVAATLYHSAAACAGSSTRPGCLAPCGASGAIFSRSISPASSLWPTKPLSNELPMASASRRSRSP